MMKSQAKNITISDEQVLEQFVAGDERAFEELVHRYYRQIYGFLARFTGNRELAEDLTQETFIKIHQSAGTFDPTRRFKPWLFAISANKARDALRAAGRALKIVNLQPGLSDEDQTLIDILPGNEHLPETHLIEKETVSRVKKALMLLPEGLREVLILAYYERLQYKEIAEMLGIPLGTVKSRLHKAVKTFGKIWKATENG